MGLQGKKPSSYTAPFALPPNAYANQKCLQKSHFKLSLPLPLTLWYPTVLTLLPLTNLAVRSLVGGQCAVKNGRYHIAHTYGTKVKFCGLCRVLVLQTRNSSQMADSSHAWSLAKSKMPMQKAHDWR